MADARRDVGSASRSDAGDGTEVASGASRQIARSGTSPAGGSLPATFEMLLSTSPVPMWVYDGESLRFLAVNDAAVARYGWAREQFLSMSILDIRPLDELPLLEADLRARRAPVSKSGPWRHLTAGGREIICHITSHTVEWEGRSAVLVASEELGQRANPRHPGSAPEDAHAPWGEAAFDHLLAGMLEVTARTSRCVAAAVFELHRLEVVEAIAGLTGAYAVVGEAVARLAAGREPEDELVRIDSRRFGMLLAREGPHEVTSAAAAFLDALRRPIELPGFGEFNPAVAGAVRVARVGETDSGRMVADVLVALRESADRTGATRLLVFDDAMRGAAAGRLEMELALRLAIRSGDELFLHYQPIVNLSSLAIEGYEALLRWDRPGSGMANPATVIEVAEESGLIAGLGAWVRGRALGEAGPAVQAFGGEALLAVNLSPHELSDPDLAGSIAALCEANGVDTSRLCVELTESSFVPAQDAGGRHAQLVALKSSGAKIAVDDFGTGYSALTYLKYLPVDIVKIDRSFVAGLDVSAADAVLVETITRMAHALDLTVIAEGVETTTQLRVLRELGVEQAQGFLFARPAIWADASGARIDLG